MPRPVIDQLSVRDLSNLPALYAQLKTVFTSLEAQLRAQPNVSSSPNGKVEQGLQSGDPMFRYLKGVLSVGIFDGKNPRFLTADDLQSLQKQGTNFLGVKQGTALVTAPATELLFPNQNDWGFYNRTAGGTWFLVFNIDGSTLKSTALT